MEKNILSFAEAVELTGFSAGYLYKLTASGVIPHSKPLGKKIFFDKQKLEAFLLRNAISGNEELQHHAATHITKS